MKGYKVFNSDWTCRDKKYYCPGFFEQTGELKLCKNGIHFCKELSDCFNYYDFSSDNKVAEIEAIGEILVDESRRKCCTSKIKIIRELTWYEVLNLVNTGKGNTGFRNSGYYNAGNYNTGNGNAGDYNTGDYNSSDSNTGCFNTEKNKVNFFNKQSDWTYEDWLKSKAKWILDTMVNEDFKNRLAKKEKQSEDRITEESLYKERTEFRQKWWTDLSEEDKGTILSLPNFDAKIFKKIIGIDVTIEK